MTFVPRITYYLDALPSCRSPQDSAIRIGKLWRLIFARQRDQPKAMTQHQRVLEIRRWTVNKFEYFLHFQKNLICFLGWQNVMGFMSYATAIPWTRTFLFARSTITLVFIAVLPMPLPFSQWEHIRSLVRYKQNAAKRTMRIYKQHINKAENIPRKAVGDMMPVLFATRIVVPDSRNGDVKSTAASRSAFTYIDKYIFGQKTRERHAYIFLPLKRWAPCRISSQLRPLLTHSTFRSEKINGRYLTGSLYCWVRPVLYCENMDKQKPSLPIGSYCNHNTTMFCCTHIFFCLAAFVPSGFASAQLWCYKAYPQNSPFRIFDSY